MCKEALRCKSEGMDCSCQLQRLSAFYRRQEADQPEKTGYRYLLCIKNINLDLSYKFSLQCIDSVECWKSIADTGVFSKSVSRRFVSQQCNDVKSLVSQVFCSCKQVDDNFSGYKRGQHL